MTPNHSFCKSSSRDLLNKNFYAKNSVDIVVQLKGLIHTNLRNYVSLKNFVKNFLRLQNK